MATSSCRSANGPRWFELSAPEEGLNGFIAGLRRCGCAPEMRNAVVVFTVVAVGGGRANVSTESGVSGAELGSWPATPPHWVHLPADVHFPHTNTQASDIPGWLKHSRQPSNWGNGPEPAQAWIAHVRGMLEEAV
jgi:hypothetical protein